jgi:putative FmdB family regulatory protein
MPIYDYKCRECGRVSEILISHNNDREIKCPDCGGGMERLIPSSSYLVKASQPSSGRTCCGRTERCEKPPCSTGEGCRRH